MSDYTNVLPRPRKTAIYYASICDDEKAPVRAQKEAIHKAWRSNFTTFKAAEREAGKLILSMVEDM